MRRAGYTNTVYTPITWSNNTVVGATALNQQLSDNMLALDNRATPYLPSVVHWTPPSGSQMVTNGTKIFLGRPSTYLNMLALSEYSPNIFVSIDVSMDVNYTNASAFSVEAALHMKSFSLNEEQTFKYAPMTINTSGYWINGSNRVSGSSVGVTQYAFWTGFKRHDVAGKDPFALSGAKYICDVSLAVSATNGSVSSNIAWALRFRANARETVDYTQGSAAQYNAPLYGQSAQ